MAHERGKMLIEMATLLMARWKAHDTENLEFKTRGQLHQLGAEGYAVGSGLVSGAVDFIEGIFNLIRLSLRITAQAFQITCEGIDQIIHGNFAQIRQSLMNAGQGIYNTAQELAAALKRACACSQ